MIIFEENKKRLEEERLKIEERNSIRDHIDEYLKWKHPEYMFRGTAVGNVMVALLPNPTYHYIIENFYSRITSFSDIDVLIDSAVAELEKWRSRDKSKTN